MDEFSAAPAHGEGKPIQLAPILVSLVRNLNSVKKFLQEGNQHYLMCVNCLQFAQRHIDGDNIYDNYQNYLTEFTEFIEELDNLVFELINSDYLKNTNINKFLEAIGRNRDLLMEKFYEKRGIKGNTQEELISYSKRQTAILAKLESIEVHANEMEDELDDRLMVIDDLIADATKQINNEKDKLFELIGITAQGKISGTYKDNAESELGFANVLRICSIVCLVFVVGLVGFASYEAAQTDFNWQQSLFRVALALLITVPAAYLAKESTKHREQGNYYLKTALDLNSIDPFIASLPEEQQCQIKAEVAKNLFTSPSTATPASSATNTFPLDNQALLMALINKIDPKTVLKSDSPPKQQTEPQKS